MQLRDYQQSVLDAALAWIKYKPSECGYVTSPGGSGKSVMIAKLAEAAADMGKRVIILARSEKLLRQNRAKIAPAYEVGIYCAGLEQWDASKQITVASIQSIANLTEIEPPDLILVDEAHNIAQNSNSETQYWDFFRLCGSPQIIGFTATPFRTGTGKIQWGSEIINIPIAPLIDAGHIVEPVNKCSNTPDLSNVQIRLGEYVESQLESIFLEPELLRSSVERIKHYSAHRESCLIFCQTVKHCEVLAEAMAYNDMPALVVHGGTPKKELKVILDRFEAREFKYLINCNLLTEGYDSPNIDMVAILRSTVSKGLFEQMVYRGCRPYPGKEKFLLLDMGGNLLKHGALGSPYREKDKRERAKSEGKVCPACEEFVAARVMQCTCGYEFPQAEARLVNHSDAEDTESATVYRGGIEEYEVTGVTYREHKSKAGNTTLRIDYHCNANKYGAISEWYSPFHDSDWARNKVYQLFKSRGHMLGSDPKTYSMDDLLWHAEFMKKPTKITVDNSDKFPRVIGCEFGEVKKPVVEEVVIIDDEIIW